MNTIRRILWCRLLGKHKGRVGSTSRDVYWMCDSCGVIIRAALDPAEEES